MPGNDTSDTDVKSDLTASSSQKRQIGNIEDFLFLPMGINVPSYGQWFRRYAVWKLMNAAEILRWIDWRELTILNF
jgi:hypothetical protein